MESKVNYTVIGIFVIVISLAAIAAAFWLSTKAHGKKYAMYAVHMTEPVSGLSEQSVVKFNGVNVGYVASINLNPHNLQQVNLLLAVEEGTPITTSTYAMLKVQGITGQTYVGLQAKTPQAPLLEAKHGQPYPVISTQPSLLVTLSHITQSLTEILDEENLVAVDNIVANIQQFTQVLAESSEDINVILGNTRDASEQFAELTNQLNDVGAELSRTLKSGQHTINAINQQAMPCVLVLLEQLNAVVANIEELSDDLKENPSILIRGKTAPRLGPGER